MSIPPISPAPPVMRTFFLPLPCVISFAFRILIASNARAAINEKDKSASRNKSHSTNV